MDRKMKVAGLTVDPLSQSPIIILKDEASGDTLPIWIGPLEATAIATELEAISFSRPMTHDLFRNVLDSVGVTLEKVVVCDLKSNTFYALLHLKKGEEELRVDARPSDAIALALRAGAPIFVAEQVLNASIKPAQGAGGEAEIDDEEGRKYAEILEGLDPDDFGKYKM